MMKVAELRIKSEIELRDSVIQLRREHMNLRFQRSTNQLVSSARFRQVRRDIARIKTIVRQKQQAVV